MKKQQGFTLIELVMVIVILGILSAVAIPKFIDLSSEAKTSAAKGIAAGISSAFAMNYAGVVIGQTTGASSATPISGSSGIGAFVNLVMSATTLPTGFSLLGGSATSGATGYQCGTGASSSTLIYVTDGTTSASATLLCTG